MSLGLTVPLLSSHLGREPGIWLFSVFLRSLCLTITSQSLVASEGFLPADRGSDKVGTKMGMVVPLGTCFLEPVPCQDLQLPRVCQ